MEMLSPDPIYNEYGPTTMGNNMEKAANFIFFKCCLTRKFTEEEMMIMLTCIDYIDIVRVPYASQDDLRSHACY